MAAPSLTPDEIRTALLEALKTLRNTEKGTTRAVAFKYANDNTPTRGLNERRWATTLTLALNKGEVEVSPSNSDYVRITEKGLKATQGRERISTEDLNRKLLRTLTASNQAKAVVHAKICMKSPNHIVTALDFTKAWKAAVADGSVEESNEGLRRKPKI